MKGVKTCLFIFFLAAGTAMAEEGLDYSEMRLEDLLSVEVTVASKTEETAADAPSTVSVFTRIEIQRMGISSLGDLLNYVPGFQSTIDTFNGTLHAMTSRGRRNGALGSDILILIDGRRLNESHTGGAAELERLITLDNIKQVEVIRGPGSALYGSNAFLGVINIVTADNISEASIKAGNINSRDFYAAYAHEDEDISFSAFIREFSDDGQDYERVPNLFNLDEGSKDPREGFDMYFTLKYRQFKFNGRHQQRELRDFLIFDRVGNGVNRDTSSQSSLNIAYRAIDSDRMTFDINGGATKSKWDLVSRLVPNGFSGFNSGDFLGGPYLENFNYNINADVIYNFDEKTSFYFGATYERTGNEDTADQLNYNTRVPPGPNGFPYTGNLVDYTGEESFTGEDPRDILGLYVQMKRRFGENLNLIVGGRFDDYSDFGNTFNPRGALTYTAPFNAKFKVMYGEAFRAPSFTETQIRNNPQNEGNMNLQPEEVETLEFAWVQRFASIQSTLTYFTYDLSQAIVSVPSPDPNVPNTFMNLGETTTRGVELEFVAAISNLVQFRGSFTDISEGNSDSLPEQYGSLIINFNQGQWNMNLNGIYRDEIAANPNQGSYWVFNTGMRYELTDRFVLQANAQNLFDEDYVTIGTGTPNIPNRGRTYNVGFLYRY